MNTAVSSRLSSNVKRKLTWYLTFTMLKCTGNRAWAWQLLLFSFHLFSTTSGSPTGSISDQEAQYALRIVRYQQCPGQKHTSMIYKDVTVHRTTKDSYTITGKVEVIKDMTAPLRNSMIVEKCEDLKKDSTCVHYMNQKLTDFCEDLKDPNSKARMHMQQDFGMNNPKCPIKKGMYTLNATIQSGKKADYVARIGKQWKAKFLWLKENDVVDSCIHIEADVVPKAKVKKSWGF